MKVTNSQKDIFLVTKDGICIRFNEKDVRSTGRASMGVIGMNLSPEDEVVSMQIDTQGKYLLIVSENGLGKLTDISEFSCQHRGGKGVKCYKILEKTGNVVGAKAIDENDEIMIITNEGIIIRLAVSGISKLGRITSGVKLIDIDTEKDIRVASFTKVKESSTVSEEDVLKKLEQELEEEEIPEKAVAAKPEDASDLEALVTRALEEKENDEEEAENNQE